MTWNSTAPDGTKSVKANKQLLLDNTQYIESTMDSTANDTTNTDAIKDHYWDVSSTFDGRHRFVNCPAFTIAGAATDPVIGSGMGGVIYVKEDSISSVNELFFRNAGGVHKITSGLSSKACSGYIKTITATPALTNVYNIASVTVVSAGNVKFTFSTALSNTNYVVNGAIGGGLGIGWTVPIATKLAASFNVNVFDNNGALVTPQEFYITVYE